MYIILTKIYARYYKGFKIKIIKYVKNTEPLHRFFDKEPPE